MKVRMLTTAIGPDFEAHPEQIVDVPLEKAREFVHRGFATVVDPADLAKLGPPQAETTEQHTPSTTETADLAAKAKRG